VFNGVDGRDPNGKLSFSVGGSSSQVLCSPAEAMVMHRAGEVDLYKVQASFVPDQANWY
jgi:hypothetical protein